MDPSTGDASLPQQIRTPNNSGVMKIGRARGPLNLWSVEAREDMFNRREAGEGWETICPVRECSSQIHLFLIFVPSHSIHV